MSEDEAGSKKSGYRLEYAASARAKCKGPKPCAGTAIAKGELRVGSIVDFRGNTSFAWRHWGCTTTKIFANMKKSFESASELDGYEDLKPEDQAKVDKAWEEGHVADEDIPESAKKPSGEDGDAEEKPKKAAPKKNAKKSEADGDAGEKPKRGRAKKAKAEDDDGGDEAKPKRKTNKKKADKPVAEAGEPRQKRASAKKASAKAKEALKDEESGEDFAEEMDKIEEEEDEEEDADEGSSKKRKRPVSKSSKPSPEAKKSKLHIDEEYDEE